ncbi:MAG: DUF1800 family protein [Bacteroidia bacterium]|nr:DUF1800 family protein [Bacteroidia bacterium]
MNRREFIVNSSLLALLAGIGLNSCETELIQKVLPVKKLTGSLSKAQLIFLLRRATLGFSPSALNSFENQTVETVLEKLLNDSPKISVPLNFEFKEDRLVPIGHSWIEAPYRTDVFYEQYRKKSLRAWLLEFNYNNPCSLRQQMLYFWLNFYSISDVIEHKYEYKHITYLHTNAWGNFKQITKGITLDPAMLRFLSGFENTKESPNENYARELLELFTLGRGEMMAKGDYTNFTEQDIAEISKVLTGWKDSGWYTEEAGKKIGVAFEENAHDTDTKHLSPRLNSAVLANKGADEYNDIIDLLFTKQATAIHFTKRLYKWFCADEISTQTHKEIIEPLASLLIENNFEVKPVLTALLSSEHFFALSKSNARIKNPLQFTFDLLHFLPLSLPVEVTNNYTFWSTIFEYLTKMGMELLKPPSVAGWKAYYQAPGYSRLWINSASLQNKKRLINQIFENSPQWKELGVEINFSQLAVESSSKTPDEFINSLNTFYFNQNLGEDVKTEFKKILIGKNTQFSDEEIMQKIIKGEEKQVLHFKKALQYLFNLPMLNIH